MNKFDELKKEIAEIISRSPLEFDPGHSKKTLEWVIKLEPNASEALQIAALAHDIERGITGITETYGLKDLSNIEEFKREHAKRSADIIAGLMKKYNYDKKIIERVKFLVEKHDEGGDDEELIILMDADSIAYFDYHIAMYYEKNGLRKTEDKIRFMFERISERAKEIIKNINYRNPEISELVKEVIKR